MQKKRQFKIIERICEDYEVKLSVVDLVPPKHMAPFGDGAGMDWGRKHIFITSDVDHPTYAIHELGHICTQQKNPEQLKGEDEVNFIGWEFLVAKRYGILKPWYESMEDYEIDWVCPISDQFYGYVTDLGYKSTAFHSFFSERVGKAIDIGIVKKYDSYFDPEKIR